MSGILNRTAFFGKLPNGTSRRLPFNLINSDLGAMVEPSNSEPGSAGGNGYNAPSVVGDSPADGLSDNAVTDIQFVKEDEILPLIGTQGLQTPRLY